MSGLPSMRGSRSVFFALCIALLACSATADGTACAGADDESVCHTLGECNTDGFCQCQPGTIDESTSGSGQDCNTNAWSIRYVVDDGDPGENPTATLTRAEGMAKCAAAGSTAQGYFVRSVGGMEEVNCLYPTNAKPDEAELAKYDDTSPEGKAYSVKPAIYLWVLPTTSAPFQIPPTGMTVDSVQFQTACAKSGCWVIKGSLATGEAFNTFGAFNTFFLPQTQLSWTDQCDMVIERDGETICWTLSGDEVNYNAAKAACSAQDGHLAKILTAKEDEAFLRMLQRENRNGQETWIGLNDIDSEGALGWTDLSSFDNSYKDVQSNNNDRDCFVNRSPSRPFRAQNCATTKFYVCETAEPAEPVQPPSSLSYDFDYSASGPINVDWTFLPVNHPCTSATYEAGSDDTGKISTCCITNPRVGNTGGFVANYRPTEAFVEWSGDLTCDYFVNRDDKTICVKYFQNNAPFAKAQDRCEVAGGKLLTIQNEDEKAAFVEFAYNLESNKFGGDLTRNVWIGLQDLGNDDGVAELNGFEWLDGWNGTYSNWKDETPLDSPPGKCVLIIRSTGEWRIRDCAQQRHYLCEFDAPLFDHTCVEHVIQNPDQTKPEPDTPCWNVVGLEDRNTFDGAEAYCVSQGGHLVSVDDAEENWYLIRMKTYFGLGNQIWIGLDKRVNSSVDFPGWIDGTDFEYENWANDHPANNTNHLCAVLRNDGWRSQRCGATRAFVCEIPRDPSNPMTCDSDKLDNLAEKEFDVTFPSRRTSFLYEGQFKGMPDSPGVTKLTEVDAFFGAYTYEIKLDEVELRSKAGILRGTVGVEHTVDTFLGMANFRPTGIHVLDTFATQIAIHLEKTSFFSVSTHGTNEYTFLEYVNMRLVTVYNQDTDFSGSGPSTGAGAGGSNDDESTAGSLRTDRADNVCYVQVTFTMGPQYSPNTDSGGLIPLDSVRAGKGTFFDDIDAGTPAAAGDLTHVCDGYSTATDIGVFGYTVNKTTFTDQVGQECGPKSPMCASPEEVPDQFVSFNVPLGKMVFEDPSNDLSNNIFVDLVVNVLDLGPNSGGNAGTNPNAGQNPMQMKTTLSASIPIVVGGINIFCDGVTAKTDLKDVANADVIVGSAANATELTRLRILQDIASTQLVVDDLADNIIDSDSIEAGLLTLVLKGNSSYFASGISGSNTLSYSMELDDVITIHIMEDGEAPSATQGDGSAMGTVMTLLATPADDNSDTNGLDTDGYQLNGAFRFTVDRDAAPGASRALLEPTAALMAVCPFNPPRPAPGTTPLETCITRRDVRSRGYPMRTGADEATAMEIASFDLAGENSPSVMDESDVTDYLDDLSPTDARESEFFVSILGDNDYAKQLAIDYAKAIHGRYNLNGRYVRAFWINPGYEWTPTQTAGKSLFQVSQKIYLFALISLDENWSVRRRMLLQTATGNDQLLENSAGVGRTEVSFSVSPASLLAQAFEVPVHKVAKFSVNVQLTKTEACMAANARQSALMATFDDYLQDTASVYLTVQVTSIKVEMNGESCDRRRRQLKADFSSATAVVEMVIVFKEEAESVLDMAAFSAKPGIESLTPAETNTAVKDGSPSKTQGEASDDSDDSDDSSSSMVPIIAGVVGGVGGVLLIGGLAFFLSKQSSQPEVTAAVQTIDVSDLKAQLSQDV